MYGLYRTLIAHDISVRSTRPASTAPRAGGTLSLFLLLKGFSSGAVALTGVEAISNGVPSFRRPESKNAANTLVWMGVILGTLFMGVAVLAHQLDPYPSEKQTVLSQLGGAVFGHGTFCTSCSSSRPRRSSCSRRTPRTPTSRASSSIIASDGYLPRQLAHRGDRLVFSNGIFVLALSAASC